MCNKQMDSLIDWLLKFCNDLHIMVIDSSTWSNNWPSRSLASLKLIYYNSNWNPSYELPMSLAHEMGHVITKSPDYNPLNTGAFNLKIENRANLVAAQLILKYIRLHDLCFETEMQLAKTIVIHNEMLMKLDIAVKHQAKLRIFPNSTKLSNGGRFSLSL